MCEHGASCPPGRERKSYLHFVHYAAQVIPPFSYFLAFIHFNSPTGWAISQAIPSPDSRSALYLLIPLFGETEWNIKEIRNRIYKVSWAPNWSHLQSLKLKKNKTIIQAAQLQRRWHASVKYVNKWLRQKEPIKAGFSSKRNAVTDSCLAKLNNPRLFASTDGSIPSICPCTCSVWIKWPRPERRQDRVRVIWPRLLKCAWETAKRDRATKAGQ